MNQLHIGFADKTEQLLDTAYGFLLIDDGPIADEFLKQFPRAKLFDPAQHSFNPLRGMDYLRATAFIDLLRVVLPSGQSTLTREEAEFILLKALLANPKNLQTLVPEGHEPAEKKAYQLIHRLLLSPVLSSVLSKPTNFSFKGSVIARINRAELGDFDALVLGTLLIGQFKGQVIVPDFGFYGRDFYTTLIRQDRLTVGLTYLAELAPKLQQAVLSIKAKTIARVTREDAERLIFYVNPQGNPSTLMD